MSIMVVMSGPTPPLFLDQGSEKDPKKKNKLTRINVQTRNRPELRSHSGPGAGDISGPADFGFWPDRHFPVRLILFLAWPVVSGPENFYMLPVRSGVI